MKGINQDKKGLSPVVAAIILIAVTVAVSIAVAAWMGSLTTNTMEVNELTITKVEFTIGDSSTGRIFVYVHNSGTSDVTAHRIRVNGENENSWSSEISDTILAGASETFTITKVVNVATKYSITLYTVDGTMIGSYVATS